MRGKKKLFVRMLAFLLCVCLIFPDLSMAVNAQGNLPEDESMTMEMPPVEATDIQESSGSAITIREIESGLTYVNIFVTVNPALINLQEAQVVFYYGEVSQEGEKPAVWTSMVPKTITGESNLNYTISYSKPGTMYAYAVGVFSNDIMPPTEPTEACDARYMGYFSTRDLDLQINLGKVQTTSEGVNFTASISDRNGLDLSCYSEAQFTLFAKASEPIPGYSQEQSYTALNLLKDGKNLCYPVMWSLPVNCDFNVTKFTVVLKETHDFYFNAALDEYTTQTNQVMETFSVEGVSFQTAQQKVPEEITLKQEHIAINLADYYSSGYNSYHSRPYVIGAETFPADADKTYIYEVENYRFSINELGQIEVDFDESARGIHAHTEYTVRSALSQDVSASGTIQTEVFYPVFAADKTEMGKTPTLEAFPETKIPVSLVRERYDSAEDSYIQVEETEFLVVIEDESVLGWGWNDDTKTGGYLTVLKPGITRVTYTTVEGDYTFTYTQDICVRRPVDCFEVAQIWGDKRGYYEPVMEDDTIVFEIPEEEKIADLKLYEYYGNDIEMSVSPSDFTYQSDNEAVARYYDNGSFDILGVGEATITVTGKEDIYPEGRESFSFVLRVKPVIDAETLELVEADKYVLLNLLKTKKLQEVPLPEGWSWEYPNTELYCCINTTKCIRYNAVYTGEEYYPETIGVDIYTSKLLGFLTEYEMYDTDIKAYRALVDEKITITPWILYDGYDGEGVRSLYPVRIEMKAPKGTVLEEAGEGYSFTAPKVGTYTIEATVYVKDVQITKRKVAVRVFEKNATDSIHIYPIVTQGLAWSGGGEANYDPTAAAEGEKGFVVVAQTYVSTDNGRVLDENKIVKWSISDTSLATIKADRKNPNQAIVTPTGKRGKYYVYATATDGTGVKQTFTFNTVNYKPTLLNDKITLNSTVDYMKILPAGTIASLDKNTYLGKASFCMFLEPGTNLEEARIVDKNGESAGFSVLRYDDKFWCIYFERGALVSTGNYILRMRVNGIDYDFPIRITVENKQPVFTAKMADPVNLFYKGDSGSIDISSNYLNELRIKSVTWTSDSGTEVFEVYNGYTMGVNNTTKRYTVNSVSDIRVKNKKLADAGQGKGTLTIEVDGLYEPYVIKNFVMKTNYKKPVFEVTNTEKVMKYSTLYPKYGVTGADIQFYNKTEDMEYSAYSAIEVSCSDANMKLIKNGTTWNVSYPGIKKNTRVNFQIYSKMWREPITVAHTLKVGKDPMPVMYHNKTTFYNKMFGYEFTEIYIKDYEGLSMYYSGIKVKGSNAKAQALIDQGIVNFDMFEDWNSVGYAYMDVVYDADKNSEKLPKGSYSFNVSVCYENPETGEEISTKSIKYIINFMDKEPQVNVKLKGSLDLVNSESKLMVTPVVKTLPDTAGVSYELTGPHAELFELVSLPDGQYCIEIAEDARGIVKAGRNYELALKANVTIQYQGFYDYGWNEYEFTGKIFKVKPKQSTPKAKIVEGDGQSVQAGERITFKVEIPKGYKIHTISVPIDMTGDGVNDLQIMSASSGSNVSIVSMKLISLPSAPKGKAYNIPVKVGLVGGDYTARACTTNLKIVVYP